MCRAAVTISNISHGQPVRGVILLGVCRGVYCKMLKKTLELDAFFAMIHGLEGEMHTNVEPRL
jgi:hypothetical protein